MTTISAYIKTKPVWTYYVLAFTISWGGILLAIGGVSRIPGRPEDFDKMLPSMILAMLAGPTVAGILSTALVGGRAALRELLSRLIRWRVGVRWYAVALLTAPLLMAVIPSALSIFFPGFLPGIVTKTDKASVLMLGVAAGLSAGIFEELGWTGFVIPRLKPHKGILTTGLIVGGLWGAWHFLVNFWSSGNSAGGLAPDLLLHSLIFSVGILPAFRVLMVWVYDRTESLLVAILMHMSLTASNVIFVPMVITGIVGPAWSLAVAAAAWAVVAVVILTNRNRLTQQSLQKQIA